MRILSKVLVLFCCLVFQWGVAESSEQLALVKKNQNDAQALYATCLQHTPLRVKNELLSKACTANGKLEVVAKFFSSQKEQTTGLVEKTETSRFINAKCKMASEPKALMTLQLPCAYWACDQVYACLDRSKEMKDLSKQPCLATGACVKKINLDLVINRDLQAFNEKP
jgi:hypothetical protein